MILMMVMMDNRNCLVRVLWSRREKAHLSKNSHPRAKKMTFKIIMSSSSSTRRINRNKWKMEKKRTINKMTKTRVRVMGSPKVQKRMRMKVRTMKTMRKKLTKKRSSMWQSAYSSGSPRR